MRRNCRIGQHDKTASRSNSIILNLNNSHIVSGDFPLGTTGSNDNASDKGGNNDTKGIEFFHTNKY